jgi:hypothetical protein
MLSIVATRLKAGRSLRGEGLHRLPEALKLIEIAMSFRISGGNRNPFGRDNS